MAFVSKGKNRTNLKARAMMASISREKRNKHESKKEAIIRKESKQMNNLRARTKLAS